MEDGYDKWMREVYYPEREWMDRTNAITGGFVLLVLLGYAISRFFA